MTPRKRKRAATITKRRPTKATAIDPLTLHDDLPASVRLVKEVRAELLAEIRSVREDVSGQMQELRGEFKQLGGQFGQLRGEFGQLRGEFDQLRGEFGQLQGQFGQLKGEFEHVVAGLHRVQTIVEEQRSENRVVLDGLKSVIARQDRTDENLKEIRHFMKLLVSAPPRLT